MIGSFCELLVYFAVILLLVSFMPLPAAKLIDGGLKMQRVDDRSLHNASARVYLDMIDSYTKFLVHFKKCSLLFQACNIF